MFGGIDMVSVAENTLIGIGITVGTSLIYRFRKRLAACGRRWWNRTRRNIQPSRCFPRHALQFARLVRQQSQLLRSCRRLRIELHQLHLQMAEKDKQLAEPQTQLLLYALSHERWNAYAIAKEFEWNVDFAGFIIGECLDAGTVCSVQESGYAYLCITHVGRKRLHELGLLPKDSTVHHR